MHINLLLEHAMPQEIDGVKIYADFRNMVRFSSALFDENLKPYEQIAIGLTQLYANVPKSEKLLKERTDALLSFFAGPRRSYGESEKAKAQKISRAYDFNKDGALIYTSFLQAYNIRLSQVDFMHWWEFLILLENLPQTTPMAQLMALRTMNTSEIEHKKTRAKIEAFKKDFLLKSDYVKSEKLSAEQREQLMVQKLNRRFEQAHKLLGGEKA